MKKFVNNISTKMIPFMGDEIQIRKLSAGAVKRISAVSKENDAEGDSMEILAVVLNEGVVLEKGEEAITVELLEEFPLDELNHLSTSIMKFAGLGDVQAEGNAS